MDIDEEDVVSEVSVTASSLSFSRCYDLECLDRGYTHLGKSPRMSSPPGSGFASLP